MNFFDLSNNIHYYLLNGKFPNTQDYFGNLLQYIEEKHRNFLKKM